MVELSLTPIRCPACNENQARPRCSKQGFSIVQCRVCTLRYVNPRPSRTWLDAWYQQAYFSRSHGNAAGAQHLQHEAIKTASAQLRLRWLQGSRTHGRLLDIGCGGGFFVRAAAADGWDAVGLEPSVEAARHAARTQRIRVVAGRLEETPFAASRFDVITMFDVLEHVFCPRTCLIEARRLLAPDGKLVIETPNMAGWLPSLMGMRHPSVRPPEHLTYFTPATLRKLLERCGLQVERLDRSSRKVLTLDYVLALTERTNPFGTALLNKTVGRWKALRRYPLSIPLDTMLVVAKVAQA